LNVCVYYGDPRKEPLEWAYVLKKGKVLTAFLSCPDGHRFVLANHRISSDGVVTPSVQCPAEGCGFHKLIRLLRWDPDRKE
tara:strand:- start:63 stop:305 length:243 start_codon:yes stop_codon:yes gene_type:complete